MRNTQEEECGSGKWGVSQRIMPAFGTSQLNSRKISQYRSGDHANVRLFVSNERLGNITTPVYNEKRKSTMLAEKKIEICIPAFNEEDIIGTALDILMRLFRDAGKNATLIVSDNASTDRTAEIARSIEGVSVISIPRRGKGAAVTA